MDKEKLFLQIMKNIESLTDPNQSNFIAIVRNFRCIFENNLVSPAISFCIPLENLKTIISVCRDMKKIQTICSGKSPFKAFEITENSAGISFVTHNNANYEDFYQTCYPCDIGYIIDRHKLSEFSMKDNRYSQKVTLYNLDFSSVQIKPSGFEISGVSGSSEPFILTYSTEQLQKTVQEFECLQALTETIEMNQG